MSKFQWFILWLPKFLPSSSMKMIDPFKNDDEEKKEFFSDISGEFIAKQNQQQERTTATEKD